MSTTIESAKVLPDQTVDVGRCVPSNTREGAVLLARNDAEFFAGLCTIRNFQTAEEIRYVERPVQRRFRELITKRRLVVATKAREVGLTTCLALLVLWECWRYSPYMCIYMSQREDNAKNFISAIRWARNKLPPWLGYPPEDQPETQSRFAIQTNEGRQSEVRAFPSVPTAIEYWHPRRIIADEWALIEQLVLPSALGAIGLDGYFVGLGTAQGLGNEHADVYTSCRDGKPEKYAPERERFYHFFSPWTENPRFVDEEGKPRRPSGGTLKDTDRMYPQNDQDCFALTAEGEPVYPEFDTAIHVAKERLKADPTMPLIRGWDFGYNRPACVVFQLNRLGQCVILAEFVEENLDVGEFGRRVLEQCNIQFPHCRWSDWGDPSGWQTRDTDGKKCAEILKQEFGLRLRPGKAAWQLRRRAVATRLSRLVNGRPALIVDPSCRVLIQGFQGMYHYPSVRAGTQRARRPERVVA